MGNHKAFNSLAARANVVWRSPYTAAAVVVAACSLLGWISHWRHLTEANIVMIFLAGVAVIAARYGRGPAVVGAVLSVLVFDYFFVFPPYSFVINDPQYFITLAVMLGIGILISELSARLRTQVENAETRERRSAQLFHMTRALNELSGADVLLRSAGEQLMQIFDAQVVIYLNDSRGSLDLRFGAGTALANDCDTIESACQTLEQGSTADGLLPYSATSTETFVLLKGQNRVVGVLAVRSSDAERFASIQERHMLQTCAGLIALSLERDRSIAEAYEAQLKVQKAQHQVQSEQLRNSLLNSISHDLRTPLSTIAVAASTLLENPANSDEQMRRDVLQTVVDESHRLGRQMENLLEMARLNSGVINANAEWEAIEELIEAALARLRRELEGRTIRVQISKDFPPLWVAGELMEKVFVNLLENAARYARPDSVIEITGANHDDHVEIVIADDGPGLPAGTESKIFEKYFRGMTRVDDGQRGIGLGLAICRSIIQAHGGEIRASNRAQGGAAFHIRLPCEQPSLECEALETSVRHN